MTLTFLSNYINHHQIPFCDACYRVLGEGFHFVQTMPMEEERRAMGWDAGETPSYVVRVDEDAKQAEDLVLSADVALIGWAEREDLVEARMAANRPTVRISERIYREGQWKFLSPRGLVHKYREHIRYRGKPFYLLAIGAYTASDFRLIGAYPGKMYRWGYFPPTEAPDRAGLPYVVKDRGTGLELLWAGRFMPLKHPEYALTAVKALRAAGAEAHLTMVGDGELGPSLRQQAAEFGVEELVTFTGFLSPAETRSRMREADIFLFTSNHLEGWGAVVSEAMGAGCAVLAGSEAGGPAVLIRSGENGLLYRRNDCRDLCDRLLVLAGDPARMKQLGSAAARTISDLWNAEHAASELLRFCDCILGGRPFDPPTDGPMSVDPALKPYVSTEEVR